MKVQKFCFRGVLIYCIHHFKITQNSIFIYVVFEIVKEETHERHSDETRQTIYDLYVMWVHENWIQTDDEENKSWKLISYSTYTPNVYIIICTSHYRQQPPHTRRLTWFAQLRWWENNELSSPSRFRMGFQ